MLHPWPSNLTGPNLAGTLLPITASPTGRKPKLGPWNPCVRRASRVSPAPASQDCVAGQATQRLGATAARRAALAPHPGAGGRGPPASCAQCLHPLLMASHACKTNTTIRQMWMKTGEVWTVCFRGRRAKAGLGGIGRHSEQRNIWNQNLPTCEMTAVRRRAPRTLPCRPLRSSTHVSRCSLVRRRHGDISKVL